MTQLHFRCTSCDRALRAAPALAGRKIHCPGCGALTLVAPPGSGRPQDPATSPRRKGRADHLDPAETVAEPPEADDHARPPRPWDRQRRQAPTDEEEGEDPRYNEHAKNQARSDDQITDEEVATDDPRRDRRKFPGWRKVHRGLRLLVIVQAVALAGLFAEPVAMRFLGMSWLQVGLLQIVLQFLAGVGYFLCTFVPLPGWSRKAAITNLGLAALLIAVQAVGMLWLARSLDPRTTRAASEASVTKMFEQAEADRKAREARFTPERAKIEADVKARREKLTALLKKDPKNADIKKQVADLDKEHLERLNQVTQVELQEIQEEAQRRVRETVSQATRGVSVTMMILGLGQVLYWLLWCFQVVVLAYFLRSVAQFFKVDDLSHTCLLLIVLALIYVLFQIALGSFMMAQVWRPGQSARFLNGASLSCILLPLTLACMVMQFRLLVRVRGVIEDYVP
jgi:hypothetical protein